MEEETKEKDKISKKEIITYILIIVIIILFKTFIATPILVSGDSMKKTLLDKDILILNKLSYLGKDIKRFDIVVIDNKNEYLIKRVIGLPGEKITYKDNKLYINDKKIAENFYHEKTADFEEKVPKDKYFVLGDNRTVSIDSRYFGAFSKEKILGKADYVIFPFKRFGKKN